MSNRRYVIKVKALLEGSIQSLFENSEFSYKEGVTSISCLIRDQSELHGLLNRIRDLNLELISLEEEITP